MVESNSVLKYTGGLIISILCHFILLLYYIYLTTVVTGDFKG